MHSPSVILRPDPVPTHQLDQKFRVAVVGCGIGAYQARAFHSLPGFQLAGLCDTNGNRASELGKSLRVPFVTTDYMALCTHPDIDIISICTPPMLHFQQIVLALEHGKNVICEKPLVGSLKEVDAIDALATQTGCWVMPIFQLRFGAGAQRARRLIESGLAGPLNFATVETAWNRNADYYAISWRRTWGGSLGGCLLGHGVHVHDLLTFLTHPVNRVSAFANTRINPVQTEDCAVASLQLRNGALANLSVTLGSFHEITRLRLYFRDLTIESNSHPYQTSSEPWTFTPANPEIAANMISFLSPAHSASEFEGYAGQFRALHCALGIGQRLPVTLGDARHSIELATALYLSISSGQPVNLPLQKEHPFYGGWQEPLSASVPL